MEIIMNLICWSLMIDRCDIWKQIPVNKLWKRIFSAQRTGWNKKRKLISATIKRSRELGLFHKYWYSQKSYVTFDFGNVMCKLCRIHTRDVPSPYATEQFM